MPRRPDRKSPVRLRGLSSISAGVPLKNDFAAALAGAGADFDDLVGRADHRFLVLDHDDRVAPIAQRDDRADQPVDVARMQADRGLVEHVEHVDQAGPQGAGQRHALGFAAAERAQRAIERQIAQADVRPGISAGPGPDRA